MFYDIFLYITASNVGKEGGGSGARLDEIPVRQMVILC